MSVSLDAALTEFFREKLAETSGSFAYLPIDEVPGVSENAIRKAARRGELRLFRPGKRLLVRRDELERWVADHEVSLATPATFDELDELDTVLASAGVERAR